MFVLRQHNIGIQLCAIIYLCFEETYIGIFQYRQTSEVGISALHILFIVKISRSYPQIISQYFRAQVQFILIIYGKPLIVYRIIDFHTTES